MGTDVDRVPRLVTRVPQVIVVVMHSQDKEVTGTGLVEEAGIGFGVEMFGIPGAQHIFIAHLRGVAILFAMGLVGRIIALIEPAGIPVAALAHRLRAEVYPEAELGLTQPGHLFGIRGADAVPRRAERATPHGEIALHLGIITTVAEGYRGSRKGIGAEGVRPVSRAAAACRVPSPAKGWRVPRLLPSEVGKLM